MAWIWDRKKDAANRRKHGISLETAELVFDDPLQLSEPDPHPDGDRWRTLGMVGDVVLFVVHTEDRRANWRRANRADHRRKESYVA
jgi:uncharacterized DUF497 family protein